jgi:hypothetical protein
MNAKLQELLECIVVGGVACSDRLMVIPHFPGDQVEPDTGYENPGKATPIGIDFSEEPDTTLGVRFGAELGRTQVIGRKIVLVDGSDDPISPW